MFFISCMHIQTISHFYMIYSRSLTLLILGHPAGKKYGMGFSNSGCLGSPQCIPVSRRSRCLLRTDHRLTWFLPMNLPIS